jgi:hypothetical protein
MGKLNATAWLIIVGILVGPAYFFYCEMFSGRVVAKGSGALLAIDLEPAMNPVSIQAHGYSDRRMQSFHAVLRLGRTEIWKKAFSISAHDMKDAPSSTTVGLGMAKVPSAGTYELMVTGGGSIQVEVRRNAREPNMLVVWSGVALLALGLLLGFYSRPEAAQT